MGSQNRRCMARACRSTCHVGGGVDDGGAQGVRVERLELVQADQLVCARVVERVLEAGALRPLRLADVHRHVAAVDLRAWLAAPPNEPPASQNPPDPCALQRGHLRASRLPRDSLPAVAQAAAMMHAARGQAPVCAAQKREGANSWAPVRPGPA